MTIYYILLGAIALVSWLISSKLKRKFNFYSKVHLRNGMSGAEIAEQMLTDHGIRDVKVVSTPGMLTDHYNPKTKTVNLSEGVYNQRNAAAAAVAALWQSTTLLLDCCYLSECCCCDGGCSQCAGMIIRRGGRSRSVRGGDVPRRGNKARVGVSRR